jgi:hypothetical protein
MLVAMPSTEPVPGYDLYAELGVPPTADTPAIEAAFRRRIRHEHPDVAGEDRAATERTTRLIDARTWLVDPVRRARYDALRALAGAPVAVPVSDPRRRPRRRSGTAAWINVAGAGLIVLGLATLLVWDAAGVIAITVGLGLTVLSGAVGAARL